MKGLRGRSRIARRVTAAALVAAAVISSSCAPAAEGQRERIDIGATTFPASAPIYVAEERGFFEEEGLDPNVHTYAAGAVALADALAGKLDFAAVAETPIARAALEGRTFRVIATVAEIDRANYIIARKDRGIQTAKDLVGRRLGYVAGTTGDFFQHIYLVTSRVDPQSVSLVDLPVDGLVSALATGDVDAVSTWPPFTSELRALLGDNALVLDEPGLYVMSWNVVAPGAPGTDSSTAERFLRALVRANEYMAANPDEALEITSRRTTLDAPTLRKLWPDILWMTELDQSLVFSLEDEARWMISDSGKSRATPDFLRFIDLGPLRQISPDDVNIIEPGPER